MLLTQTEETIQHILDDAVATARTNNEGAPADYIPELAGADLDLTSAAMTRVNGEHYHAGDANQHIFTLQSVAKFC